MADPVTTDSYTDTRVGWQDYLAIIIRRRMFFIAPTAVIVLVSMVVGLFLPKYYRAEAVLLVEDKNVMNPLIQGLAIYTPVGERLRTLREEMLSWTSLSRLTHELGLDKRARSPIAFERLIKDLQRDVQVGMRGGNLVMLGYEDREPKRAQLLVNTLTQIYMDRNVESQSAEAETAITFIESEMVVYKKKLEDAERALRDFKELYVMQMPVANQLNDEIVKLEVNLAQLFVDNTEFHPVVVQVQHRINELKQKRNDEIKRVIITALAQGADPAIYQDLVQALDQPEADTRGEINPTVRTAKEAYKAWVARLDSPAETPDGVAPQVVVSASPDADPGLLGLMSSGASLSLSPREEQELARLTRDYQVHSKTYQSMKERLEQAKVTQRLGESEEGTKFKILEPARLPLKPVRPNHVKIFIFSLLLGMMVGAGAAFVAEYLDQSFQTAEDLQAVLGMPVVGSISTIVTHDDLEAQYRRRMSWMSVKKNFQRFRVYVVAPLWGRVDRLLVRWGL